MLSLSGKRSNGAACQRAARPAPASSCRRVVVFAKKDEPDLIERMVGAIFGKKVLEDRNPMGLKRLNFDELPDQFVVMDKLAEPVSSDDQNMRLFRPLMAGTQLEKCKLRCAYDADVHGWTAPAFHTCVDGFGAALVLGRTEGGAVFGGYNPEGWISLGEDRASNGAFLFTWPDGDTSKKAVKLPKIGGPNLAVIDKPDSGPQFGAEGLTIPLSRAKGKERIAKSRLGTYYERLPDRGRSLFAADEDPKAAPLIDLKVYVAEGEGVEWNLDGITWKTSKK